MRNDRWRALAAPQDGVLSRGQLADAGVARSTIRRRIARGDWLELSPTVVSTTAVAPSREQMLWLGLLHAGPGARLDALTAAQEWGLRRWERERVSVVIPHERQLPAPHPALDVRRSRRDLAPQTRLRYGRPAIRIEPAALTWASRQASTRTMEGVLAATVQQGLTSPAGLLQWLEALNPLRHSGRMRAALLEIDGGAQSVGELDVRRMCRRFDLALPRRQVRRRDSRGRLRFTDCEWLLPGGRTLVLEVDGAFHMDVDQWEDDIARQRALTSPQRVIIRCTARELRDEPDRLAADLRVLGVPAA